ncbi:hypothetical protein [Massilia sp. CF038]|uniref:hypothetical protein n=1 Tax=Massilia sp. CF038 TaxID=1881045 RepID=UPI000918F3B0|nr:hypothetical protein [Massilia sp. CF038]SHG54045.1 hypothetical protein SAMN05428948_0938 [Massilia sp. CF038]
MSAIDAGQDPIPFNRYEGKPFLKYVDSFILKAIGQLDPAMDAKLVAVTPKLQETLECDGTWEDIVMAQLDFGPEVRDEIRRLWEANQVLAKQAGGELTPMQFVTLFVADNIIADE